VGLLGGGGGRGKQVYCTEIAKCGIKDKATNDCRKQQKPSRAPQKGTTQRLLVKDPQRSKRFSTVDLLCKRNEMVFFLVIFSLLLKSVTDNLQWAHSPPFALVHHMIEVVCFVLVTFKSQRTPPLPLPVDKSLPLFLAPLLLLSAANLHERTVSNHSSEYAPLHACDEQSESRKGLG